LYDGVSRNELIAALDVRFERSPAGEVGSATLAAMEERGALCLVAPDGTGEWLTPRDGSFDRIRALDSLWLEDTLAGLDHRVTYQHGVELVVDAVRSGDAVAAILIRPVSVAEIERTARERLLMPPKSTFFTPKLRTGLVIRSVA